MYKIFFAALLFVTLPSCQKCFECKQYCATCQPANPNGVTYKFCADKLGGYNTVDSLMLDKKANGYNCKILQDDKRICDAPSKLNDATNYYLLQNYYCVSAE